MKFGVSVVSSGGCRSAESCEMLDAKYRGLTCRSLNAEVKCIHSTKQRWVLQIRSLFPQSKLFLSDYWIADLELSTSPDTFPNIDASSAVLHVVRAVFAEVDDCNTMILSSNFLKERRIFTCQNIVKCTTLGPYELLGCITYVIQMVSYTSINASMYESLWKFSKYLWKNLVCTELL